MTYEKLISVLVCFVFLTNAMFRSRRIKIFCWVSISDFAIFIRAFYNISQSSTFNLMCFPFYSLASMSCSYVLSGHIEIILCIDTCVSSFGKTLIVTRSKDNSLSFLPFDLKIVVKALNFLVWEKVLKGFCSILRS